MNKLVLICSITALLFSKGQTAMAQSAPVKQWDKSFGGSSTENLGDLKQLPNGEFIITGASNSGSSGNKTSLNKGYRDGWVIKLDAGGNKIFDKVYGGLPNSESYLGDMVRTNDGGFIFVGSSNSLVGNDKSEPAVGPPQYYNGNPWYYGDIWLLKIDSIGNKIWDKTYGGSNREYGGFIKQTPDGGYIIGGLSESGISGNKSHALRGGYDYWLIKIDSAGNKLWDKTYGTAGYDELSVLQVTSDKGFILGGYTPLGISFDKSQPSKGLNDFWIIKLDSLGNKMWDKSIGGNDEEFLTGLEITNNGHYILSGGSRSNISGNKSQISKGGGDFWVLKLDPAGNKIWDKSYGGSDHDLPSSLSQTPDGNFLLAGYSNSGISGDKTEANRGSFGWSDYWIMKLNPNGDLLWEKTLGGSDTDGADYFFQTLNGGYIVAGVSYSGNNFDKSESRFGQEDIWVVKLGPEILGLSEESKSGVYLYPNPNKGRFSLQLNDLNSADAEFIITDLTGKIILRQELEVLNKKVAQEINLQVSKGMYLLQLKTKDQVITRKIIVE